MVASLRFFIRIQISLTNLTPDKMILYLSNFCSYEIMRSAKVIIINKYYNEQVLPKWILSTSNTIGFTSYSDKL